MLRCREISEQASRLIDGELSASARLEMAMHLLLCGRCRHFVDQIRLVVAALRSSPGEPLSPERAENLAAAAMAAEDTSDTKKE